MLVISSLVAAQNAAPPFQIKGVLLDSLTQEGEPYATIKIVKKEAPAHALKMLVTDMKGKFQEKVPMNSLRGSWRKQINTSVFPMCGAAAPRKPLLIAAAL